MKFDFADSLVTIIYFENKHIDIGMGFQSLVTIDIMKNMWKDMYKSNIQNFTYTGFLYYFVEHDKDCRKIANTACDSLSYTI